MKSQKVFISGPYSGDELENLEIAKREAIKVIKMGGVPTLPHLSHYLEEIEHFDYELWMSFCFRWIEDCDIFYQFAESPGATQELKYAKSLNKVIFFDAEKLEKYLKS